MNAWIGVDLDGTLAHYGNWKGKEFIGEPIPAMVERVKRWLASGKEVKIFTARAQEPGAIPYINEWQEKHLGVVLEVTNVKDYGCIEIWDDRAIQVIVNTGRRADGKD